jgi:hypothetical protein
MICAGTKGRRRKFEDEAHSEETQVSVCTVNLFFHHEGSWSAETISV